MICRLVILIFTYVHENTYTTVRIIAGHNKESVHKFILPVTIQLSTFCIHMYCAREKHLQLAIDCTTLGNNGSSNISIDEITHNRQSKATSWFNLQYILYSQLIG